MTDTQFLKEALAIRDEIVATRRDIHRNPELGGKEYRTCALVKAFLDDCGIEYKTLGETAVVGLIRGGQPGKTVALRADMDALPMQEANRDSGYCSLTDGVMHACGHDVHTTALLYAARLLSAHRDELRGNVKLFFEPGEEVGGFARMMVNSGAMEDPKVDGVFAFHQTPSIEAGTVCCHPGQISSASGRFCIDVRGKASHGAEPHNGVDAIAIGCQIVTALQQCVSRMSDPEQAVVLTIGKVSGGEVRNVVAKEFHIEGIHRTPTIALRTRLNQLITDISTAIGRSMGAEVIVTCDDGASPVINDAAMLRFVKMTAEHIVGAENISATGNLPITAAEDCGEFFVDAPGCYYNIGSANAARGITAQVHSSEFDVDEDCLPIAVAMQAGVAFNFLQAD